MSSWDKRSSVAPEAMASSVRSRGTDGPLRSVPPAFRPSGRPSRPPRSEPRPLEKPAKEVQQCIRHDARSAYHSLSGFLELLSRGTLGSVSDEQRLAMAHIRSSAQRLMELTESSIELGLPPNVFPDGDRRLVSLEGLLLTIVNTLGREQPQQQLDLQSSGDCHGLLCLVEPEELSRTLRILIALLAGLDQQALRLRLTQSDSHAVLVLSTCNDEESVSRSMPVPYPAVDTVEAVSEQLESREYVRLKRCESMLQRQQGTLLVADDLTRLRITLPKHSD